jgi:hypothetical protein
VTRKRARSDVAAPAPPRAHTQAGLARYGSDKMSSLARYIKLAATLPNKTVRDVALRVRWIGRKDTPRKQRTKARARAAPRRACDVRRGRVCRALRGREGGADAKAHGARADAAAAAG